MYIQRIRNFDLFNDVFRMKLHQDLLSAVTGIAREAGKLILTHFESNIETQAKSDASPITVADLEAHHFIRDQLESLYPTIPVISEESLPETYDARKSWSTFWLVDPLDGTKEFIKRSGYFTVNIALVEDGLPVMGVIEVPFFDEVYYAYDNVAYHVSRRNGNVPTRLRVRPVELENIAIVASRDHSGPAVQALCNLLPHASLKSIGSSLKFCLVAAGIADVYLRDVPTMEWDTAAAHAILRAAGGDIYTLDGTVLTYNKESLRNPHLISVGSDSVFWLDLVKEIV